MSEKEKGDRNMSTNQETTESTENTETENTGTGTTSPDPGNNDDANESGNPWEKAFPGKTPDDVLKETQDWKQHSREWEKRAKSWKKQVDSASDNTGKVDKLNEKIEETNTRLGQAEAENGMFRDLIALEIETGTRVPISQLADSIAFRDAYMALDRDSDDFADKLQKIVEKRTNRTTGTPLHIEVPAGSGSAGADLYQRMFNKDKEK